MPEIVWGKHTEEFAISLSSPKLRYKRGEPISVSILFKNFGTTAAPIVTRSAWYDYALIVRYADVSDIPKTANGRRLVEAAAEGRRAISDIAPGQTMSDTLDLDQGYDVKAPGIYQVIASREVYKRGSHKEYATVTSNSLKIEVFSDDLK